MNCFCASHFQPSRLRSFIFACLVAPQFPHTSNAHTTASAAAAVSLGAHYAAGGSCVFMHGPVCVYLRVIAIAVSQ